MKIKEWLANLTAKTILWVLAIIVAILIIFRAGMILGFHQAAFSYRFGERYYQSFGRSRGGPGFKNLREEFGGTYGASGKIIKIALPKIIIEGEDNTEKVVAINNGTTSNTLVRAQRESIQSSDLKIGDNIIVLGSPNENSEIDARLIRVMPPAPTK